MRHLWIILIFLVAWMSLNCTAGENMLVNTSFENSSLTVVGNWQKYTYGTKGGLMTVVPDGKTAHSGNVCIRLETKGGAIGLMQGVGAPWAQGVWPGRTYLVGGYAKSTSTQTHFEIAFHLYGEHAAIPKGFKSRFSFTVTDEWQRYITPITIPEGVTYLNVNFDIGGPGPLFIDDVFLHSDQAAQVRYLPSLNRLVVSVDPTFARWQKQIPADAKLKAEIVVVRSATNAAGPVLTDTLADIGLARAVWRKSTESLAEGDYTVRVRVLDKDGIELGKEEDWFEKKEFEWMKHPRGVGEEAPTGYSALETKGLSLLLWGREYRFGRSGLLEGVTSQGKEWLKGPVALTGEVDGQAAAIEVERPFEFTRKTACEVSGKARLKMGGVAIDLEAVTEYDGLLKYRLTYGPQGKETRISRLRVKAPLTARWCKFYSADGAPWKAGPSGFAGREEYKYVTENAPGFSYDVLPQQEGMVFNGLDHQQSAWLPVTFNGLFWVGDEETCFCYAADNDKGWVGSYDKPAVEAIREGDQLVLWLNLVNREVTLKEPRTLEFALQAGPLKALPEGWRGIQCGGDTNDAPLTVNLANGAGSGYTLAGGVNFIHPGTTPEQHQKSKEKIEKEIAGGNKAVVGYHFWGTVPKGLPETRVFRTEWGIDKETWEARSTPREWEWKNRFYGENTNLYIIMSGKTVPSYVDFISYAYDEALKYTALSGFYDDCGFPRMTFDEELGQGYVREDGTAISSSGVWAYRERWKRAAYVNFQHKRPNYLWDSQHVRAHYMPAYGFIGIWAPCEHGYYNPFKDRDNLEFYGSLERYMAFNPSRAFGQISMIGMASSVGWHGEDAVKFARDTRCMMMLTFLNDQDVGCFGARDPRIVNALRHARSGFKTWEKDVAFVGYWQNEEWVKTDKPEVKTSLYHRPDGVLFVLGNVGSNDTDVVVAPDWKKLKLDPARLVAVDAESGKPLTLEGSWWLSPKQFKIKIPRHDVRLVVVGPAGKYVDPNAGQPLGTALPAPKEVVKEMSDAFTGPELDKVWTKDGHEGSSGAAILDGRLCVWGNHYGFSHVRRELKQDNVSVQCLIMRPGTGGSDEWGGSLFLYWPNGEYAQATPGTGAGKFTYLLSGVGRKNGADISKQAIPGWNPYFANWVKIVLKPEVIEFYGSADGKAWVKDWEAKRGEKHKGAPEYIMLGNGSPGKEPLLKNPHPQHFAPNSASSWFFSDLIVGKAE